MRTTPLLLSLGALVGFVALVQCASEPPPQTVPPSPPVSLPPAAPAATTAASPPPPPTPRHDVNTTYDGTTVIDPYQWLESSSDAAVRAWSEAENAHARAVLDGFPERPAVKVRVAELLKSRSADYSRLVWRKRAGAKSGTLFALENRPPKQQPFIVAMASPDDPASERVVLDPNVLDPSGKTSIDFYSPSLDGAFVAVSLSQGGSEHGDLHVYEVATGKERPETIPRVNSGTAGGSATWVQGGIYYTRLPHEGERAPVDLDFYQQVWFHKLGTKVESDTYALGKDAPRIAEFKLQSSDDGGYVLATVANGDGGEFEHYLRENGGKWQQVARFEDKVLDGALGKDGRLYLLSRKDAPKGKVLRTSLAHPSLASAEVLVPESDVVIEELAATRTRLFVVDLAGGPSQVRVVALAGKAPPSSVPVLPVSSVGQIVPLDSDEVLYRNESYVEPPGFYRYTAGGSETKLTALHQTSSADFRDSEVVQESCTSRDGTKVPLNLLRRKGVALDGNNPTLLTAYGGYGVNQSPRFRAITHFWLEAGGVYAVAVTRGGGEFGEAWHDAGKLTHKQNVFDDFYACAQHLVDDKMTNPARLAILGGSNGGLLMGAELTQHPEAFRAVVSRVGIYDMLRVELTPNGAFNTTEFGTVKDPEQFKALYAYSPYHHVKQDTVYPAILMMTGANDPRVDPWQSRKMVAALQAAAAPGRPVLLRTNGNTGHGLATPLNEQIDEQTDIFAFLVNELQVRGGSWLHPSP